MRFSRRQGRMAAVYAGVICVHALVVAVVLHGSPPRMALTRPPAIEVIVLATPPEPDAEPEPETPLPVEPKPVPSPAPQTGPAVSLRPDVDIPETVVIDTPAGDDTIPALVLPQGVPEAGAPAAAAVQVLQRMACLRSGPGRPEDCDAADWAMVSLQAGPAEDQTWFPPAWAQFQLPEPTVSLEDLREHKCLGRSGVIGQATEENTEYFLDGPGRASGRVVAEDRGIFCD